MAGQNPEILCVGFANWDVVLRVDELPDTDLSTSLNGRNETLGGSAANTAVGIESLGADTALLSRIGTDTNGSRVKDTVTSNGVTAAFQETDAPTNTIYCVVADGHDPQYLSDVPGPGDLSVDDVPDLMWAGVNHVHLTSFDPELAGTIAEEAAADGKTVSFNPTQDYEDREFPRVVQAADLVIVNETETEILRERYDVPALIEDGMTLVETHGSDGATVKTRVFTVHHDGFEVTADDVVDPVGAGDSFVAALLARWISSPVSPHHVVNGSQADATVWENLLADANAAGAYAVLQDGAPTGLSRDSINQILTGSEATLSA